MMEPIAVIGLAYRFPGGADSPARLWDVLTSGQNLSREPDPDSRLNLRRFHSPGDPDRHGSTDVTSSYFLDEDPSRFDAGFFGVSPLEAEAMDPQQRLLLETVYEASESAGLSLASLKGSRCSVFVGVMTSDYPEIQLKDTEDLSMYTASGASRAILANRISYFFDLRGSSVCLDTACSSSLVALHLAVQDLRGGGGKGGGGGGGMSDIAVVAGSNLIFGPDVYITESKLHMLSPTGTSKMWDEGADGYARGEGVAALFLKPLSKALRDGDPVVGLIRGTGVNSDGRTPGITMPSATAQARLIQETYRAAGLDPDKVEDRCQYFEAHGTGTKAGDPVEARGIFQGFFEEADPRRKRGRRQARRRQGDNNEPSPLLVGSIKTVIGHLEGCAGLAGVVKVLLAMKKGVVPPNQHLEKLNPEIEPLRDFLRVPTEPVPWPQPAPGQRKRASVNSFGFGGTNAHVIVESYEDDKPTQGSDGLVAEESPQERGEERLTAPIVLSASSRTSLLRRVEQIAGYIRENPQTSLRDLAWTLQTRRSELGLRVAIPAATRDGLLEELDHLVEEAKGSKQPAIGTPARQLVSPAEGVGILGIFTGQGAQWPGMGRELLLHNGVFRRAVRLCQEALAGLPDAPQWSLEEELLKDGRTTKSRVAEAEIAQPATTAVEIGLVDVLQSHGVRFTAVVGHSSGEIAALYAAGILTMGDAIRIAYYRGKYAHLAGKGSMLAAGLSWDAALELCRSDRRFKGRVWPAAKNSPSSVTLSGDVEAIQEMNQELQRLKVFSRPLHTDKAYHSPHMQSCADAYLEAMKRCRVRPKLPSRSCVWVSSVGGTAESYWDAAPEDLQAALAGQYWVDNMVKPVLFADAVTAALTNGGPFDAAIEVGPHAALKGPVSQTVQPLLNKELPYRGAMSRGEDCVEAVSQAVGFLWTNFGSAAVPRFPGADKESSVGGFSDKTDRDRQSPPQVLTDLPSYPWDHDRSFWRESRISRNNRLRGPSKPDTAPSLLGRRCTDDTDQEPRWRNFLSLKEVPWLRGHSFQGQALFPAAGYIVMVLEAAQALAQGSGRLGSAATSASLVEIENMIFERTLSIGESRPVELITSMTLNNSSGDTNGPIAGTVCFHICSDASTGVTERTCSGSVKILLSHADSGIDQEVPLPPRVVPKAAKTPVDVEKLYSTIRAGGLQYDGRFMRMDSMHRAAGISTATASFDADEARWTNKLPPPFLIDTGFQALFGALAAPTTDRLWTPYLDHGFVKLTIDLRQKIAARSSSPGEKSQVKMVTDAHITLATATRVEGDLSIYLPASTGRGAPLYTLCQIEGMALQALLKPDPSNDRHVFSETIWEPEIIGGGDLMTADYSPPQEDLVLLAERVAFYMLRVIIEQGEAVGPESLKRHERLFVEHARRQLRQARDGELYPYDAAWAEDDCDIIYEILDRFAPQQVDFRLLRAVGEEVGAVFRGERQMLKVLFADDMLGEFYRVGLGLRNTQRQVARYMRSITHRFPGADVLELGAGTGATTAAISEAVGNDWFGSYTFTDVSAGFFPDARERFSGPRFQHHLDRMDFRRLDITLPLEEQGFDGTRLYDVIVAANVLHIAPNVDTALRRVRQLLRPGGYLVAVEATSKLARIQVILGGLEGWWPPEDTKDVTPRDGCVLLSSEDWDARLVDTGFSGLDVFHGDQPDVRLHTCTSFVSQALGGSDDGRMSCLREPLRHVPLLSTTGSLLVIVGGATIATSRLVRNLDSHLSSLGPCHLVHIRDLKSLSGASSASPVHFPDGASVLCLAHLDLAVSHKTGSGGVNATYLGGMQTLLARAGRVLFVTQGAYSTDPMGAMLVGLLRCARSEQPSLAVQLLDIESDARPLSQDTGVLLEHFLRFVFAGQQQQPDSAGGDILWSTETELLLRGGKLFLPRIRHDVELNERANAQRRPISKLVSKDTQIVEVRAASSGDVGAPASIELTAAPRLARDVREGEAEVEVSLSTLRPVVGLGSGQQPRYLCAGTVSGYGDGGAHQSVLALAKTNASRLRLSNQALVDAGTGDTTPEALALVAVTLVAQAWVASVAPGQTVWVHGDCEFGVEPDVLIDLLQREASKRSVQIVWTAPLGSGSNPKSSNINSPSSPIRLHTQAPVRVIRDALPKKVAALIVTQSEHGSDFAKRMQAALGLRDELCGGLWAPPGSWCDDKEAALRLTNSLHASRAAVEQGAVHFTTITSTLEELASTSGGNVESACKAQILDWTSSAPITANIQPIDATELFRPDRTYLMIGLTGDLGLSICAWMIRQGVRHLLLSSRTPNIDEDWLAGMTRLGAKVVVKPMDVGSWESVRHTLDDALACMPPVAGVCNGAMVLSDDLFSRMNVATAVAAMQPKVDGSLNLDRYFSTPAMQQLDFFMLFSSVGSIIGLPGQSNYHMANLFMATLAADRQRRGLVGSVIDVGVMLDIGYITRQSKFVQRNMQSMNVLGTWEEEVHQLFAEGVFAGIPGNTRSSPEIIMGLKVSDNPADRPFWAADPRLAYFVKDRTKTFGETASVDGPSSSPSALEDLRTTLASEAPLDETRLSSLVRAALCAKLEKLLQSSAGSLDMGNALVGMGVDSLLAMEVRSWILKTIGAEVPVLQILGGITGDEICQNVVDSVLSKRPGSSTVASEHTRHPTPTPPTRAATDTPSLASEDHTPSSQDSRSLMSSPGGPNLPVGQSADLTPLTLESSPLGDDSVDADTVHKRLDSLTVPELQRRCPMSLAQERIWFLHEYLEDPTSFNETAWYDVEGPLDIDRLKSAFNQLTARHEILRTRLSNDPITGLPVQTVWSSSACKFHHVDARQGRPGSDHEEQVVVEFEALKSHTWNLEAGECFGLTVVRRSSRKHTIIAAAHHIAVDGLTWVLLLRDLTHAYNQPGSLARMPPPRPYTDFAMRQRGLVPSGALAPELQFWKLELKGLPEDPLPLFPGLARVPRREATNVLRSLPVQRRLDRDAVLTIKRASSALAVTPFHFHLAALRVLVGHLSGASDLCIGTCESGTLGDDAFAETVGFFLNMVPIRLASGADDQGETFGSLCKRASARAIAAMTHSRAPLDALLEELRVARSACCSPLFQVIINYRLGALAYPPLGSSQLDYVKSHHSANPYDLALTVMDMPNGACQVELAAQEALYSSDAASRILDMYCRLVDDASRRPDISTLELAMDFCGVPRAKSGAVGAVKNDFSKRPRTPAKPAGNEWAESISGQVQAIARLYPNDVAVKDGWGTMTYSDLIRKSSTIASTLEELGRNDTGVRHCCLLFQPSADYITSLLGVLDCSAVAVPLDTRLPKERLLAMVKDCRAATIIHHRDTADVASWLSSSFDNVPRIDVSRLRLSESTSTTSLRQPEMTAPMIMVYTSGTTGTPKGAVLTQANYWSIIEAIARRMKMYGTDAGNTDSGGYRHTILQQTSFGFDLAMIPIVVGLCTGARLVVATAEQRRDPAALTSLALQERVTMLAATPTEFEMWFRHGWEDLVRCNTLRTACVAGEAFPRRLAAEFHRLEEARGGKRLALFNVYGPTETTIASNIGLVDYWNVPEVGQKDKAPSVGADHISVGPPLQGVEVYILDEDGHQLPPGSVGEVFIGGAGVGLGYLGRPDLTKAAFVSDMFISGEGKKTPMMYRTGDSGVVRPDGSLVVLGRIDGGSQVKIRGIRIELEDISSTILRAARGRISHAVATVRGEEKAIVAFAVPSGSANHGGEVDGAYLESLAGSLPLPEYMRPAAILQIDKLPTNQNGKLDREALARMPLPTHKNQAIHKPPVTNSMVHVDPRKQPQAASSLSSLELEILDAWQQVLPDAFRRSSGEAGPESDFFRMGGNSMSLVSLRNTIRQRWRAEVPLVRLYEGSTLRDMATILHDVKESSDGDGVDWESETRFDPTAHQEVLTRTAAMNGPTTGLINERSRCSNGKTILITGATMQLGAELLKTLLARDDVATVHCVAVPPEEALQLTKVDDTRRTIQAAMKSRRLFIHEGYLDSAHLGLSDEEIQVLLRDVDAIVHAGAQGSCLNNYNSIRDQNVGSTKFLAALGLACQKAPSFHLLSSARVILFSGKDEYPEESVSQFYPPRGASICGGGGGGGGGSKSREGFTATKWASERFLENCAAATTHREGRRCMAAVTIHRTGYLMSDAASEMDAVNMIHRFADRVGAVPAMDRFSGFLDMCEVEWAAARMADSIVSPTAALSSGAVAVRYTHHTKGDAFPVGGFHAHLERKLGRSLDSLSMEEWAERAERAGMSPFLASFLRAVCESRDEARYPKLLLGSGEGKAAGR
ncbi:hypothetical protein GGTG_11773 [Gaeumannomyces tritici R3-111a-1]|uniref:Polyketide synthase n=1 Tax=Gaeumannomyces tritici (strain R3-111a-1) TaxID=644352 RepID=J3PE50_GAET3|nr:hypothetical protein GGTG_11773 [Gaeumannomyces tritici R3-111a-1]EJT70750.1 hypothetical protein GGTG_11773 [Gaeumannomyces tritici R3-111a-1]